MIDESNSLHFLVEFNRDADVKFLREISTLLELNLEVLMNQNPLGSKYRYAPIFESTTQIATKVVGIDISAR